MSFIKLLAKLLSPNSLAIICNLVQEIFLLFPSQNTLNIFLSPSLEFVSFNSSSINDINSSADINSSFSSFFCDVKDFMESYKKGFFLFKSFILVKSFKLFIIIRLICLYIIFILFNLNLFFFQCLLTEFYNFI